MIRFSSFDLRTCLRILLLLAAWKLLSTDYSALSKLIDGWNLHQLEPEFLDESVDDWKGVLFDTPGGAELPVSVHLEHLLAAVGRVADQSLAARIDDEIEEFQRHLPDQNWNVIGRFQHI
jgi:hypothetical protein